MTLTILLTQTDLSLLLGLTTVEISQLLQDARQNTGKQLLTKGYFFDQGLRPTHKAQIVTLYEQGMDEATIAHTTQHSPTSIGRYLRDYEWVKELASRPSTYWVLTNVPFGTIRTSLPGKFCVPRRNLRYH